MRQALHLLIVHAHTGEALAAQYGSRWLLPIIACGERVRADPKAVRWTADRGIDGHVAGQWLGRVSPEVIDWLMVLRAVRRDRASDEQLTWTALEALASTPALIEYQGWAVRRTLEQTARGKAGTCAPVLVGRPAVPSVPGPFGRFDWIEDVKGWIRAVTAEQPSGRVDQFRSTPHEVVLRARTRCGDVYFKGLTGRRRREPRLTQALAAIAPAAFARTLALEERPDGSIWWLTAGCAGGPTIDAQAVARALAHVQRQLIRSAGAHRELTPLDLDAALRWGIRVIHEEKSAKRLREQVRSVLNASLPHTWIPMDLHPTNVLVDLDGNVRFIDLDESFVGPAPLPAALFATRIRDASLYAAYERSWGATLGEVDWPAFEAVASLVGAWLGWQRVKQNVRRGEVHGALEIARTRIRARFLCVSHRV